MVHEKDLTLEERVRRLEVVVSYRVGTVDLNRVEDGHEKHRDAVEELRKIQREIIGPFKKEKKEPDLESVRPIYKYRKTDKVRK